MKDRQLTTQQRNDNPQDRKHVKHGGKSERGYNSYILVVVSLLGDFSKALLAVLAIFTLHFVVFFTSSCISAALWNKCSRFSICDVLASSVFAFSEFAKSH